MDHQRVQFPEAEICKNKNVMIYFVVFIISSFLCEQGFAKKKPSFFLIGLAVLLPAFLAGVRDDTIGTDRLVYGDLLFYDVLDSQDLFHLDDIWTGWIEPGYIYLNVLLGRIWPNINFFYFVLSLIQGVCVLAALKVLNIRKYAGYAYAAYLFLFFQPALNLLRQSLSVSVSLLCVAFMIKNKKLFAGIAFLLAISFHNSAIIVLPIMAIVFVLSKVHSLKVYTIVSLVILVFLAWGGWFVDRFAPILNIEASRYSDYFAVSEVTGFSNTEMVFALLQGFFIFLNFKKFRGNSLTLNFFVFVSVASIPLSQVLMFGGDYVGRLIVLFNWLMIPMYAIVLRLSERKKTVLAGLSLYVLSFWFYHYIYLGWNQTYPYTSAILDLD